MRKTRTVKGLLLVLDLRFECFQAVSKRLFTLGISKERLRLEIERSRNARRVLRHEPLTSLPPVP